MFDVYYNCIQITPKCVVYTSEKTKKVCTGVIISIIVNVFSSCPPNPRFARPSVTEFQKTPPLCSADKHSARYLGYCETFVWACMCYSLVTRRV